MPLSALAAQPQWFAGVGAGWNHSPIKAKSYDTTSTKDLDFKTGGLGDHFQPDIFAGVEWNQNWRSYVTYNTGSTDDAGVAIFPPSYIIGQLRGQKMEVKQRQLLFSTDYMFPLNQSGTRLFAGLSAGANYLNVNATGTLNNQAYKLGGSDTQLAYGGQAGIMQRLGDNWSMELGVRYLRHNNEVKDQFKSAKLNWKNDDTQTTYLNISYLF